MTNKYQFTEEPHCHRLNNKPLLGVTTVLDIMGKTLTWWASGMAVAELGWLHKFKDKDGNDIPKGDKVKVAERQNERILKSGEKLTEIKGMTIGEYLDLLDSAYKAHNTRKEKRAQEGTDIHALVEKWIAFRMSKPGYTVDFDIRPISKFIDWEEKNVRRFLFSEIHCYSESLWCGGKTDFAYEDVNGQYVLADVKSRPKLYFSDFVQCGAYDMLLRENGGFDASGNKIWKWERPFAYHAMFPITDKFKEPFITNQVSKNQYAFTSAIQLYKLKEEFEDAHGN